MIGRYVLLLFIASLVAGCVSPKRYFAVELELALDEKRYSLRESWRCEKNLMTGSWRVFYKDGDKVIPVWLLRDYTAVGVRKPTCRQLVGDRDYRIRKIVWVQDYRHVSCDDLRKESQRLHVISARVMDSNDVEDESKAPEGEYGLLRSFQQSLLHCKGVTGVAIPNN